MPARNARCAPYDTLYATYAGFLYNVKKKKAGQARIEFVPVVA